MPADSDTVIAALASALEHQRARMLTGDFDLLAEELGALEAALASLPIGAISGEALNRLREIAWRNAGLLEASARGVRSVRRRIGEIGADRIAGTYTADGRRVRMDRP